MSDSMQNDCLWSININQLAVVQNGLLGKVDYQDLVIFYAVRDMINSKSMQKKIANGREYTWCSYAHILRKIPILNITVNEVLGRRIKKLVGLEIFDFYIDKKDNSKTYIAMGSKWDSIEKSNRPHSKVDTHPTQKSIPDPTQKSDKSYSHFESFSQESFLDAGASDAEKAQSALADYQAQRRKPRTKPEPVKNIVLHPEDASTPAHAPHTAFGHDFLAAYTDRFKVATGSAPAIDYGRIGKTAKTQLSAAKISPEEIGPMLDAYFADKWWRGHFFPVSGFLAHLDKWRLLAQGARPAPVAVSESPDEAFPW